MRRLSSLGQMRRWAERWREAGRAIGFVPTMGYLHAGHLSLVNRARRAVGPSGAVVVSIYVNPTQFGPSEDLKAYPRDMRRDLKLCRDAGVDVVFTPDDGDMYPRTPGREYSTYVIEESLSLSMEGASRPAHFRGVATIVAKLFHLVQPTVAVFGQKDFQQAAVIRRMTRDLHFPVKVIVGPTVREPDGLAMSSRNAYLSAEERREAGVLWSVLRAARKRVRGARAAAGVEAAELNELVRVGIAECGLARLDYAQYFDPASLEPMDPVTPGAHMALAVYFGRTRLIDNGTL